MFIVSSLEVETSSSVIFPIKFILGLFCWPVMFALKLLYNVLKWSERKESGCRVGPLLNFSSPCNLPAESKYYNGKMRHISPKLRGEDK
jgi:hypothetical protein